ncbi:MAG: hypothetical protein ABJH08_02695 [Balneola sp.]
MIYKIILPLLLSYGLFFTGNKNHDSNHTSVNAVIGDISFIEKFGVEPDNTTEENLRLTTHLKYVENKLRTTDVSHLSAELRVKRSQLLDYLKEYIEEEAFPKNYHYPKKRQSVFIDKNGAICAVGYLVERSVDRSVAEEINAEYKFSSIFDIQSIEFESWVAKSGFTKKELAMIQPMYGSLPPQEPNDPGVTEAYDVSSSVLVGVNTAMSFVNASIAFRGSQKRTVPIAGLVTGTTQLVLGVANYPKDPSISKRKRELSILNIGFGSLTVALSSYNLLNIKNESEKSYAVRLKSFSLPQNNPGVGIGFSKRF